MRYRRKRKYTPKKTTDDPPIPVLQAKIEEIEARLRLLKPQETQIISRYEKQKISFEADKARKLSEIDEKIREISTDPANRRGLFERLGKNKDPLTQQANEKISELSLAKFHLSFSCGDYVQNPIPGLEDQLILAKSALRRQLRITAKKQKLNDVRAAISAADGKTRELASRIKHQLERQELCPYCGNKLGDGAHADHIYPVSKGGRSHPANMIIVCAPCNSNKSNLTLRAFILKYGLSQAAIEKRLLALGKEF